MEKNAESKKFVGKELITLADVRAILKAVVADVHSGAITTKESLALQKKAGERLKQIAQLLKDNKLEELKSVME